MMDGSREEVLAYMTLETIDTLSDNPRTSLPALAA
jgi:hypothetical protein